MTFLDPSLTRAQTLTVQLRHPLPAGARRPPIPTGPRSDGDQGSVVSRVRAWMVVLPVDAAMLLVPTLWSPDQVRAGVVMAVLSVLLLSGGGRYRARLHLSVLDELPTLVTRLLTAAALVATVIALRHDQESVSTFLAGVAAAIGLVVAGRVATTQMIAWSRRRRSTSHPTVIVGGGALAAEITQILHEHPRYGLTPIGFVDDSSECIAQAMLPRLGLVADLDSAVAASRADVVLVADGEFSERRLLDAVRAPSARRCDLLVVPRMHHFATQTGTGDHIGSIPVMRIRTPNLRGPAWALKRIFDVVVAGIVLVLVAPIMAACALAVRAEGGRDVIFRQARVGRNGVLFDCLKMRSMRPVDDTESATNWSVATDRRVGPVGRVLRRTSLDELPQLWNIVRGDMTLVGPRPERPHFVDKFSAEYDRYAHRHRVQAGLTGLAQVSGLRGDTSIADRARYDNYYIEHWSLWLDIKIVIRTFSEVLFARGALTTVTTERLRGDDSEVRHRPARPPRVPPGPAPRPTRDDVGVSARMNPEIGRTAKHIAAPAGPSAHHAVVGRGSGMELRDYLHMLRHGWVMILVITSAFVALAAIYQVVTPKRYEATTALLVSAGDPRTSTDLQQGGQFAQTAVATYAEIVDSPTVLGPVAAQLRPQRDTDDLVAAVTAAVPADTTLINIAAGGSDPEQAATLANATAASAEKIIPALVSGTGAPPLVRLQQIRRAVAPVTAANPSTSRTFAIGLLVGLAVGLATTIVRQSLDTRIRRVEEVRAVTELPVLGVLPRLGRSSSPALVARDDPEGVAGEAFRTLRTNLRLLESTSRRSLLFAAATEGEENAHELANLAWTLAQDGRRVLVVDLDLRHNFVADAFGLEHGTGLSDVLAGRAELPHVIRPTDQPRLQVVVSGTRLPSPSDLLRPSALARLFSRMEQENDCVLLHAPSILATSDAALAASVVGGAFVTVTVGRTRTAHLATAISAFDQVRARPLGLVLTGARGSSGRPDWPISVRPRVRRRGPSAIGLREGKAGAPNSSPHQSAYED